MTTAPRLDVTTRHARVVAAALRTYDDGLLDSESALLIHTRDYTRTALHRYHCHRQALGTVQWARRVGEETRAHLAAASRWLAMR